MCCHDQLLDPSPTRFVLRKRNALNKQVGQLEEANISLMLDAGYLPTVMAREKIVPQQQGKRLRYFEPTFVKNLRDKLSQWDIDLWLQGNFLRGKLPDCAHKDAATEALMLEIRSKVWQVVFVGLCGVPSRANIVATARK